ncbi:MAG: hypothetical protein ABIA93_06450, partial [Candidatus Woesearchaeota archaeon]
MRNWIRTHRKLFVFLVALFVVLCAIVMVALRSWFVIKGDATLDIVSAPSVLEVQRTSAFMLNATLLAQSAPFCSMSCNYVFRNAETGDAISNASMTVKNGQMFTASAKVSISKTGEGIIPYVLEASCQNKATAACSEGKPAIASSLILVRYHLSSEDKTEIAFVDLLLPNLLSSINRVYSIGIALNNVSSDLGQLGFVNDAKLTQTRALIILEDARVLQTSAGEARSAYANSQFSRASQLVEYLSKSMNSETVVVDSALVSANDSINSYNTVLNDARSISDSRARYLYLSNMLNYSYPSLAVSWNELSADADYFLSLLASQKYSSISKANDVAESISNRRAVLESNTSRALSDYAGNIASEIVLYETMLYLSGNGSGLPLPLLTGNISQQCSRIPVVTNSSSPSFRAYAAFVLNKSMTDTNFSSEARLLVLDYLNVTPSNVSVNDT